MALERKKSPVRQKNTLNQAEHALHRLAHNPTPAAHTADTRYPSQDPPIYLPTFSTLEQSMTVTMPIADSHRHHQDATSLPNCLTSSGSTIAQLRAPKRNSIASPPTTLPIISSPKIGCETSPLMRLKQKKSLVIESPEAGTNHDKAGTNSPRLKVGAFILKERRRVHLLRPNPPHPN